VGLINQAPTNLKSAVLIYLVQAFDLANINFLNINQKKSRSGMKFIINPAELLPANVGINLGSGYLAMPQH
jgi:hypothetical protein